MLPEKCSVTDCAQDNAAKRLYEQYGKHVKKDLFRSVRAEWIFLLIKRTMGLISAAWHLTPGCNFAHNGRLRPAAFLCSTG
jgi:hypothetical protein